MPSFVTVARTTDVPEGEVRVVTIDVEGESVRLAVAHVSGNGYHVVEDVCTHDGGPLGQGKLHGTAIECPRHGARFDVCTGKALCMPAITPVRALPTRVEGDEIQVDAEGL